MKILNTILVFLVFIFSSSAFAEEYNLFKTCTYPLMEGEFRLFIADDRKSVKVFISEYESKVINFHLGPVSDFDFESDLGIERVTWAVDGGHQLSRYDEASDRFIKTENLTCY